MGLGKGARDGKATNRDVIPSATTGGSWSLTLSREVRELVQDTLLVLPNGERAGTSYTISCLSLAEGFRGWGITLWLPEKGLIAEVSTAHCSEWSKELWVGHPRHLL